MSLPGRKGRFAQLPTMGELCQWLTDQVSALHETGRYVGGWSDPDRQYYCLDVSIVVVGLQAAMGVARVNEQSYIFDPTDGIAMLVAPRVAA